MRYILPCILFLSITSCFQKEYEQAAPLKFKKVELLNTKEYSYPDLLLRYLKDSNELIINEAGILHRLTDSIDYYLNNGSFFYYESYHDSTKAKKDWIYFNRFDDDIRCSFYRTLYFFIGHRDSSLLFKWEPIKAFSDANDTIIQEMTSFKEEQDMDYKRLAVDSFPETVRPKKVFFIDIDMQCSTAYKLYLIKSFFANTVKVVHQLRSKKSQSMFQKEFEIYLLGKRNTFSSFIP